MIKAFSLGRIVATPGALQALERANQSATFFLARHAGGDWGELERHDVRENEYGVAHGFRLLSSYATAAGEKALDYNRSRPICNHAAFAGRVLTETKAAAVIPTQIDRLPEFLEFEARISNQQRRKRSMSETSTLIGYSGRTIGREELALVPTPAATETHRPVPHHEIVQALIETLGFRHIGVVHDEYAVSPDGMKAFGVLDLATEMEGCRFSIGLRNSHDKSMRLAMTCGYRVFVCSNMAFAGDFTPVLAKHSKSFSLIDCISVGVDRMQRNFEPMRKQVEAWQRSELTDVTAKVVIYEAFVEGRLEAPKHLARTVHDLYFEPKYEDFRPRTIWSLSNAFTSAFKELDPIPQFRATAKLGEFLEARFSQSF